MNAAMPTAERLSSPTIRGEPQAKSRPAQLRARSSGTKVMTIRAAPIRSTLPGMRWVKGGIFTRIMNSDSADHGRLM